MKINFECISSGSYEIVKLLVANGARDIEDNDSKKAIDLVDLSSNSKYIQNAFILRSINGNNLSIFVQQILVRQTHL